MAPMGSQDRPKNPQDGPETAQDRPKRVPRRPKSDPRRLKTAPRWPNMAIFLADIGFAKNIENPLENQCFWPPRLAQHRPKRAPRPPKIAQDSHKMAPRGSARHRRSPQEASRGTQKGHPVGRGRGLIPCWEEKYQKFPNQ